MDGVHPLTTAEIFVELRSSWKKPRATSLAYHDTEKFLRFIDKYGKQAVGNHNLSKWMKLNVFKTLLDRIIPSDIAYAIIHYENSDNVWREELEIKATRKTKEERQSARRHQKPRYHMQVESASNVIVIDGQMLAKSTTQNCTSSTKHLRKVKCGLFFRDIGKLTK